MGTETSKNPLLFLYYQGSLFPSFLGENAGELRFIALERKVVPLQLPSHIQGPNMRERFKR